ncbi:MAG: hypothetical protein Q4B17_03100 [Lautropia sp.]|nr:hypothetical protein [Lautropia sp.]
MNALGWLILGLLAGWAVEFAIDFFYWRKKARLEAEALVQQEALLLAQQTEFGHKQSALRLREKEVADLQASVATRDAELLQAARRMEERSDDLSRLEQQTEKRRADLDRMNMTLSEREKDIASRQDQLRSKEADYGRRLNALEATEQELARRVAVVANREDAMQSWEGRILSREHDVTDREASVNYHASRVASDAAAFDAAKHLLKQRHRTSEGRDNLQALVGIDQRVADLLRDAGIRSFERLAETSLGELTRILEGAGPRFALANPLSWAEQAAHWLNEDYVALDRLQCELLGIERESVGEQLLAQMTKPATSAVGAAAGAEAGQPTAPKEGHEASDQPPSGQLRADEATAAEDGAPTVADAPERGGQAGEDAAAGASADESQTADGAEENAGITTAVSEESLSSDTASAIPNPSTDIGSDGAGEADGRHEPGAEAAAGTSSEVATEALTEAQGQREAGAGRTDGIEVVQAASDEADELLSLVAAEEVDASEGGVWKDRTQAVADAEDVALAPSGTSRDGHGR